MVRLQREGLQSRSRLREIAAKAIGAGSEHLQGPPNDKPIVIADWNFQTRAEHTVIQLFVDAAVAAWFAAAYYCALMKLCDEEDAPISRVYRLPRSLRASRYYHRTVAHYCHRTSRRESE